MAKKTQIGTSGNDTLDGASNQLLMGGTGDDTYNLTNEAPPAEVIENASSGTDTIVYNYVNTRSGSDELNFTLGDNVENFKADFYGGGFYIEDTPYAPGPFDATLNFDDDVSQYGGVNANIIGNALNNVIETGLGSDELYGYGGKDTLIGGDGSDYYEVDSSDDVVIEKSHIVNINYRYSNSNYGGGTAAIDIGGVDFVYSHATSYTLSANVEDIQLADEAVNATGNASNNNMDGNGNNNLLSGLGGDDEINGDAGNDTILGGDGNDRLFGGGGKDSIDGGNGDDNIRVNENGSSTALGGAGNDTLYAINDDDADTLTGGAGNDLYQVSANDVIVEAANGGVDTIELYNPQSGSTYTLAANVEKGVVFSSDITLIGNASDNSLISFSGNNVRLEGLAGNDYLDGGNGGAATLVGGDGNDSYQVFGSNKTVIETNAAAAGGIDTVYVSGVAIYTLGANVENLTFMKEDAFNDNTIVGIGNALNNKIVGNNVNNFLAGGDGNDTLDGGLGNDTMAGGNGADVYIVDRETDAVAEIDDGVSSNRDKIIFTSNYEVVTGFYNLGANFEDLDASATSNSLNITGNNLSNKITTGSGNDILDGRGGSAGDTLAGGNGNDNYFIENAADVVIETATGGTEDTVTLFGVSNYTLAANVENAVLSRGALNLTANASNNDITGNGNNNSILGGAGNDSIYGDYGQDTLKGEAGDDTLDGGASVDTLDGGAGNDTYIITVGDKIVGETAATGTSDSIVLAKGTSYSLTDTVNNGAGVAFVENFTYTGNQNFTLTGNALNNALTTTDGNDSVDGGAGNDSITGGNGNDTLIGGAGNDTLDGGNGQNTLDGGAGDDAYFTFNQSDVITDSAGNDTVNVGFSFASYTLGTGIENATLVGSSNSSLVGNNLANKLTGNDIGNSLVGNNDTIADTLAGGKGDDFYLVTAVDVIVENAASGFDTVALSGTAATYTLGANLEQLNVTAVTSAIKLTGNTLDNTITGNSLANTIDGADGNDALYGNDGNDSLIGGAGNDGMYGGNDNDTLDGGVGNDNMYGGVGNDKLIGGAGNDILKGEAGNDTMEGGAGDDVYFVTEAADVVTEAANAGTDTIAYYVSGAITVAANVEVAKFYAGSSVNVTGNSSDNSIYRQLDDRTDTINGGAGSDTLQAFLGYGNDNVTITATTTISNIEAIDLSVYGGSQSTMSWDLNGADGTSAAPLVISIHDEEDVNLNYGGIGAYGGVTLSNFGENVVFDLHDLTSGYAGALTLDGNWGPAATAQINLSNVNISLDVKGADNVLFNTEFAVSSSLDVELMDTQVTNLIVTGEGELSISNLDINSTVTIDDYISPNLGLDLEGTAGGILSLVIDNTLTTLNTDATSINIESSGMNSINIGAMNANSDYTITGSDGSLTLNGIFGEINAADFDGDLTINAVDAVTVTGGAGNDSIIGSYGGDDIINGGDGIDVLVGLNGLDTFVFDNLNGSDIVVGFNSGDDSINLDISTFANLGSAGATLSDGANFFSDFNIDDANISASTASVLFDIASGILYYDADGNGSGLAQEIGIFLNGANIQAGDIHLIA